MSQCETEVLLQDSRQGQRPFLGPDITCIMTQDGLPLQLQLFTHILPRCDYDPHTEVNRKASCRCTSMEIQM